MSTNQPPSPSEDDVPTGITRELAERQIAQNEALRFHTLALTGELGKWLLAVLVTINGGALIALLNLEGAPKTIPIEAAGAFVAGIGLAVAAAILQLINAAQITQALGVLSQPTAMFSKSFAMWSVTQAGKPHKFPYARVAFGAVIGSLLSFLGGAVTAGITLN